MRGGTALCTRTVSVPQQRGEECLGHSEKASKKTSIICALAFSLFCCVLHLVCCDPLIALLVPTWAHGSKEHKFPWCHAPTMSILFVGVLAAFCYWGLAASGGYPDAAVHPLHAGPCISERAWPLQNYLTSLTFVYRYPHCLCNHCNHSVKQIA